MTPRAELIRLAVEWLDYVSDGQAEGAPPHDLEAHFREYVRLFQPPGAGLERRLSRPAS